MAKLEYKINEDICTSCGLCRSDCPSGAVKVKGGTYSIALGNCIHCGHCGAVCPAGAVTCDGMGLPPYKEPEISQESMYNLLAGKRSVRRYGDKPIPSELINNLLEVGALTSTASNSMDVRASVFAGEEALGLSRGLCGCLLSSLRKLNNPPGRAVARLFGFKRYASKGLLTAFDRKLSAGVQGEEDPLFFKAPAVICLTVPAANKAFGRTNAALAGQSMMLYAHSQGIESCMIGFAEMAAKSKKGRELLKVPADRKVGLVFTLGYGKSRYHRLPVRESWRASEQTTRTVSTPQD